MSRVPARPPSSQVSKQSDLSHIESEIDTLYSSYIIEKTLPIEELERALQSRFTTDRFVSLRGDLPKGLNAGGSQLLESSARLWLLCIAIKLIKTPTMKSILPLLKAALSTVVNKKEVIEGLDPILSIQDIEITGEDHQTLEKLLNLEASSPETVAISDCGKFALIRLTPALQKKLQWSFAVTPVDGNDWVTRDSQMPRKPLATIFVESGYSYHPGSSYKS